MIAWALQNGAEILAVLEFFGLVLLGVFAFTGVFDTKLSDRRNESDKVADGLIDRLQKTVDQNAKDMLAMSARIDDQQKEIHVLQGKNEAYLQIITLRDPVVKKVFDEAPEIYQIARETHGYAKAQADSLKKLTDTMEEFLNRMPAVMPTMTP